jgi:hypothetical protein
VICPTEACQIAAFLFCKATEVQHDNRATLPTRPDLVHDLLFGWAVPDAENPIVSVCEGSKVRNWTLVPVA